ncbi:MAG TPA: hypothetical protein VLM79_21405 [Kofleriaceae bacterium]|nr:hypothetical protein [Kofleriaceae bacterium]
MRAFTMVGVLASALAGTTAHAQNQIVPADANKGAEDKDIQGWNPFLGFTSTVSLVDNSSVIGQVDGFSTLFGLGLLSGADYVKDEHLLRLTLTVNEGFARTPVVERFVKTNDNVKLEGLYNYFVTKYLGAYGRLSLSTSVLSTTDVRGTPTSWVDITGDTPTPLNTNAFSQRLAGAFSPFTITEAVGGFADAVRKDEFSLALRLGVGGRHTFAEGVRVAKDDSMTPEVELLELSDVHQLGAEAFVGAIGKLDKAKANYKAGIALLLPFVNNDKFDRSATSLTRIAFEGNLTYAMSSWLSVVYSLAIIRDPQLFPAGKELVQVQNTVLLTFQMNLVRKQEKEKAKEKSKEEQELEDARRRADEAEKRATDAERKLLELQSAPPGQAPPPTTAPAAQPPAPTPQ